MAGETKDSESVQGSGDSGNAYDVNEFIGKSAKEEPKAVPVERVEEKKAEHKPQPRMEKKKNEGSEYSGFKGRVIDIYDNQYKKLLIIPAAVIIAAVVILLLSYSSTGSFFKKDISLSGGVSVIAVTGFTDTVGLESGLVNRFPDADVSVRSVTQLGSSTGVVVEAAMQSEQDIDALLDFVSGKIGVDKKEFSVQKIGASLGSSFFSQLTKGMIFAFIFMALAVFVYFRIVAGKWLWLPGLFVIWTAFVDILCTLAVVSITGLHLSAAGLAAFLMLIGYSVDTDILLTVRALKGTEARLNERIRSAVRTGVLMSLTAFGAVVAGYFFAEAETIKQIMFILSAGMIFDIIHTWLTNAGLLRWYLEKKGMV
ncbi:hypothetical protein HYU40_03245 [Candidatus Woesearchaeota archaeon]|nr:hypothetical protein [Candidatus Woesearchaeota archaeon]